MTATFITGLAVLALVAIVDVAAPSHRTAWRTGGYLLGTAGAACVLVAGSGALAGHRLEIGLDDALGFGPSKLVADRLSGLFLVICFAAAVPLSLALAARAGQIRRRGLGACYALTLGAVAVIVTARNVFALLFAWEALTIAFYLLAGFERDRPGRPRAALITLVFGKVSGAFLLFGLLLLAGRAGSFSLDAYRGVPGGALHSAAYALLILGFAVKAGLVPMQVWMPAGYAAAPGPIRAIMAGVAVNVGFYGLWRTLEILGAPPRWLAAVVLLLAALTAVLGISHAAVQTNLQRVIAYSSVENTGLILTGYGVALVGASAHLPQLVAVGLLAATLQVVAHTAAKSLLFTGSAQMEDVRGTSDLEGLGGTGRQLRWSGAGFTVGAVTLAGLPPTAGFVSEWFLLEALMQQFRVPQLDFRIVLAITGAAIALTAGFAAVTFVRLVGLIVLGPAPPMWASHRSRKDYGLAGRTGIVLLCVGCLVLAAVTPLEIRALAAGLSPVIGEPVTSAALKSPWVLQPVFTEFSILSPSWLWVMMPLLFIAAFALSLLASRGGMLRVRRVPAWRSATAGVQGADRYTPFGYANPTRKVLANVLLTRTELRRLSSRSASSAGDDGARLGYTSDVIEVVEAYLYRPVLWVVRVLVRFAKRLQSGRLDAYIAYMLIALIGVLAVVTALA
jgi:hydrogenase-4 component B